jgi:hypothetical protein
VLIRDFFSLQTKKDSRIVQGIRRHVKGGITTRFVWIENQVRYWCTVKAQVKTGRLPATKVCSDKT